MSRINDLYDSPSDRACESRRYNLSRSLVEKLTAAVELLTVYCDNRGSAGDRAVTEKATTDGHDHGYGYLSLPKNVVLGNQFVERDDQNRETELNSRHIGKTLLYMCSDGYTAGRALAADTPLANKPDPDYPGIFGDRCMDLFFLTGPGTKTVGIDVWLRRNGGTGEANGVKLYAALCHPHRIRFYNPPDEGSARFALAASAESEGQDIASSSMLRFSIGGLPAAPRRINRLRLWTHKNFKSMHVNIWKLRVFEEVNQ